jgi:hypothetical protein
MENMVMTPWGLVVEKGFLDPSPGLYEREFASVGQEYAYARGEVVAEFAEGALKVFGLGLVASRKQLDFPAESPVLL